MNTRKYKVSLNIREIILRLTKISLNVPTALCTITFNPQIYSVLRLWINYKCSGANFDCQTKHFHKFAKLQLVVLLKVSYTGGTLKGDLNIKYNSQQYVYLKLNN